MALQTAARRPSLLAASRKRRRAAISLTPLIDVVFILLVFFMLASSFLDWRAIDLDAPARAGGGASLEGALLVELRPDGIRLSGETVSLAGLAERAAAAVAERPEQKVLVWPSEGVPLQDTVLVLDRLTAAGVAQLSLIRQP